MIDEKFIAEAIELAEKLQLEGRELLRMFPTADIMRICNGIGPAWFPARLRSAIDALHKSLVIASLIHDLAYYADLGFHVSNLAFEYNGIKLARYFYGWYDPRRYLAIRSARRFKGLLDVFGRPAYDAAQKERLNDVQNKKTKQQE